MGFAAGPQATGGGFTAFVRIQMVVSGMGEPLRGGCGMTASGRGLPARTDTARHGLGRNKDFGRQEEERGACEEMKGGNGCQLEGSVIVVCSRMLSLTAATALCAQSTWSARDAIDDGCARDTTFAQVRGSRTQTRDSRRLCFSLACSSHTPTPLRRHVYEHLWRRGSLTCLRASLSSHSRPRQPRKRPRTRVSRLSSGPSHSEISSNLPLGPRA